MGNDGMKVGAVDDSSKSPIKQWDVEKQTDIQEGLLDNLNKQLSILEEKLNPIMTEQLNDIVQDSDRESLYILANIIRNKNDRISAFIQTVDSINHRIEL